MLAIKKLEEFQYSEPPITEMIIAAESSNAPVASDYKGATGIYFLGEKDELDKKLKKRYDELLTNLLKRDAVIILTKASRESMEETKRKELIIKAKKDKNLAFIVID